MDSGSTSKRTRWAGLYARESTYAWLVFVAATIGAWAYLTLFNVTTGPEYNIGDVVRPALCVATGHGLSNFFPDTDATNDFLSKKTMRMEAADFPRNALISPKWHDKFYADRYCLVYSIGWLWRLFGISWKTINTLLILVFGVISVLTYGIFRLGMGRLLASAGTALAVSSPVVLSQLPSIRDFAKAPFILAAILCCGYLLVRPVSRRQLMVLAALMGAAIGIGAGFRQDSIICLPPVVFALLFFARGDRPFSRRIRLVAALLTILCFVPPAFPAIRMTSNTGGNNAFYLTQGFSAPSLKDLDLRLGSYRPLNSNQDDFVHAYIATFLQNHFDYMENMQHAGMLTLVSGLAQLQANPINPQAAAAHLNPAARLELWTKTAEMAARRYVYELAITFPADVITRVYASVLRILRNVQPLCYLTTPNALLDTLLKVEAPMANHQYRYGPLYALLALACIARLGYWRALGAFFLLMYFFGYPSLEFLARHAFHLNFIALWCPLFVLGKLLQSMSTIRRTHSLRGLAAVAPPMRTVAAVILSVTILLALPLGIARWRQDISVARLQEQYQQALLEPLPSSQETDKRGSTISRPDHLPTFESVAMPELWNALSALGAPIHPIPSVLAEYLVAEIETTEKSPQVSIVYGNSDPANADLYLDDAATTSSANTPHTLRFFFPAFCFTQNVTGQSHSIFKGIAPGPGVQIRRLYRVRNIRNFPFLMNVWLPAEPSLFRNHHELSWFRQEAAG